MAESGRALRVAVVEDEGLYRDLLCRGLADEPRLQVVGAFADPDSALAAVPHLRPDVAVLDINLGARINGVQLGLLLRESLPNLGLVLLSNHRDPRFLPFSDPRQLAGWSYLLKRSVEDVPALRRAIEGAAARWVVLDAELLSAMRAREDGPIARLNARERRLLQLIAEGFTNSSIARHLLVAEKTIENQVSLLYQALGIGRTQEQGDAGAADGLHPRVQAVLMYLRASRSEGVAG